VPDPPSRSWTVRSISAGWPPSLVFGIDPIRAKPGAVFEPPAVPSTPKTIRCRPQALKTAAKPPASKNPRRLSRRFRPAGRFPFHFGRKTPGYGGSRRVRFPAAVALPSVTVRSRCCIRRGNAIVPPVGRKRWCFAACCLAAAGFRSQLRAMNRKRDFRDVHAQKVRIALDAMGGDIGASVVVPRRRFR